MFQDSFHHTQLQTSLVCSCYFRALTCIGWSAVTLLFSFSRKPRLIKNTVLHLPCCTLKRKTSKRCACARGERYCFCVHAARFLHLFCFRLQHWLLPYCQYTCHSTINERSGHIMFASLAFSHARHRSDWMSEYRSLDGLFHIFFGSFVFTFN